jgi:hypothetical protein
MTPYLLGFWLILLLANDVIMIVTIGKPRKPIAQRDAAWTVGINTVLGCLIVAALMRS